MRLKSNGNGTAMGSQNKEIPFLGSEEFKKKLSEASELTDQILEFALSHSKGDAVSCVVALSRVLGVMIANAPLEMREKVKKISFYSTTMMVDDMDRIGLSGKGEKK